MGKNGIYQEIITEVSDKLSKKLIDEEKYLVQRATVIDKDIKDIVQEIGLLTTQKVLEDTRDKVVSKKSRWNDNPQESHNRI